MKRIDCAARTRFDLLGDSLSSLVLRFRRWSRGDRGRLGSRTRDRGRTRSSEESGVFTPSASNLGGCGDTANSVSSSSACSQAVSAAFEVLSATEVWMSYCEGCQLSIESTGTWSPSYVVCNMFQRFKESLQHFGILWSALDRGPIVLSILNDISLAR